MLFLRAGLESHHFSSQYGFDFGALKRSHGWYPQTWEEVEDWYGRFIQIAVDLGKTTTTFGSDARAILGGAFRGLWVDARMNAALTVAAREFANVDGWPDGWIGIRNTLNWDKERMDAASLDELKLLEKEIAPRSLGARIQAKVLSSGSFGEDLVDDFEADSPADCYLKTEDEAKVLGKAAAQDEAVLTDLAPFIAKGNNTNKVWHFGVGVGGASNSAQGILERLRPLIEFPPADGFELQFIGGLISGWNQSKPDEVSAFLDKAIVDEVWGPLFPSLQLAIELDQAGYLRLIKSLEAGRASCWEYMSLGYGRRTDALTVMQIATILSLLALKPDGGLPAAIDVLCMVIHCSRGKDEQYRKELQAYCLKFVGLLDWSLIDLANENRLHHLNQVIEFGLDSSEPHEEASRSLNRLIQLERSGKWTLSPRIGNLLLPFFKNCPVEALDAVYVRGEDAGLMRTLTVRLERNGDTAIGAVPEESLIGWCRVSPEDRCVFAAQTCKLFGGPTDGESGDAAETGLSSTAINLLALAPDKKKVLDALVRRFYPSIWSGSLSAILRKRLQHLDQLNPTNSTELAPLIEEMKAHLLKSIENLEQREQARERSETASFE